MSSEPQESAVAEPAAAPDPQVAYPSPPPRKRSMGGMRSMVLSMAVLIAMTLVLYALVARPKAVQRPSLDAVSVAEQVRSSAGLDVSVRNPTPQGWSVNAARYAPAGANLTTYHVGYVASPTLYYGIDQAKGGTTAWQGDTIKGFTQAGTIEAGGSTWMTYTRSGKIEECALVRLGAPDQLSTIVQGTTTCADVAAFVGTLSPVPR